MKTITVDVTAEDIAKGCQGDGTQCPIAHAIRRKLEYEYVSVGDEEIYVESHEIPTPGVVFDFIAQFDLGRAVEPFRFDLEIPDDFLAFDLDPAAQNEGSVTQ